AHRHRQPGHDHGDGADLPLRLRGQPRLRPRRRDERAAVRVPRPVLLPVPAIDPGARMRTLISSASLRTRRGRTMYRSVLTGTAVVFLLVFFFPLYWMITGAVKHPAELALPTPTFVPHSFHPESFVDAWSRLRIAHYFG